MHPFAISARFLAGILLVLALAASGRAGDINDLRQALKAPVDSLTGRESALRGHWGDLRQLNELTQALFLAEWRDDDVDAYLAAADRRVWVGFAARFTRAVQAGLKSTDLLVQIEAIEAVGHAGELAHVTGRRRDLVCAFTPDLIRLLQHAELAVVKAAARALGNVRPDPQQAVLALKELLSAEDARRRAAAAEGLRLLMHSAADAAIQGRATLRADALRAEAGLVGSLVVPVAARGLADEGVEVRRAAIAAMLEAGAAANALVCDPPGTREPGEAFDQRSESDAEQAALGPLVFMLQAHAPAVGRLLKNSDPAVGEAALRTLGETAHARRRLLDHAAATHIRPGQTASHGMPLDPIASLVGHPNAQVRLSALDILEALGADAAPVASAVIKALSDSNRFVRWAAARALGRMAPADSDRAVPALIDLLRDPDADLRVSATRTLAAYGPAALPALLPLTAALASEDPVQRVAALHALENIGSDAKPALAAIRDALEDRDSQVRRSAARLLGKFGPYASEALNSLRLRLNDSSPEVRAEAREALRCIAEPNKTN
jgi:HEAT repeat protein